MPKCQQHQWSTVVGFGFDHTATTGFKRSTCYACGAIQWQHQGTTFYQSDLTLNFTEELIKVIHAGDTTLYTEDLIKAIHEGGGS